MRLELRPLLALGSLSITFACTPPSDRGDTFGSFTTSNDTLPGDGDGDTETSSGNGDGDGDGDAGECGNGQVEGGEQCDLGPENAADGQCTPDCQIAACGDGYHYADLEECDDGNTDNADECVGDCKLASCGDGFVQTGVEECDDGNDDPADGCNSMCMPGACGDGILQEDEQCDDGNRETSDECPACELAFCGDGYVQAGVEECDDGNDVQTDGCIPTFCTNAECGDGIVWAGMEQCDDANEADDDTCPTTCQDAFCGDGFELEGMEECDDGNNMSGDGCDSMCVAECDGDVLLQDWNGWTYYKVPVEGAMTDVNVAAACMDCGLDVPCTGLQGCGYNGNICTQTNNEPTCNLPMNSLSGQLCGNGVSPNNCQALWGVYQYMGQAWVNGSACGAEQNIWCAAGNSYMNKYALCVEP